MIRKLERRDVGAEMLFTEQKLPRALPPRRWREHEARGELPELDEGQAKLISEMTPDQLAAEALEWHELKPSERARWLGDDLLNPRAVRMVNLHARGFHLRLSEPRGDAGALQNGEAV